MTVAEVLARIPGWEDSAVTRLHGGTTNTTLLVDNGSRRAVLKIDNRPRRAPFNTRSEEARIQSMAAAAGLATEVLFTSETVLLTGFAEGEVWTIAAFGDKDRLAALGRALRKVHALPLAGRVFDAPGAARDYARAIRCVDTATVHEYLEIIEQMPRPCELALCHNDLVAENILSTPAIRLLDWEYACDNDPLFDLATIIAHHGLSASQSEQLLDAYFDGDGRRWRDRLAVWERCYDALHWLWRAARHDVA